MARGEGGLSPVGYTPRDCVLCASLSCVWWSLQALSIGKTQRCWKERQLHETKTLGKPCTPFECFKGFLESDYQVTETSSKAFTQITALTWNYIVIALPHCNYCIFSFSNLTNFVKTTWICAVIWLKELTFLKSTTQDVLKKWNPSRCIQFHWILKFASRSNSIFTLVHCCSRAASRTDISEGSNPQAMMHPSWQYQNKSQLGLNIMKHQHSRDLFGVNGGFFLSEVWGFCSPHTKQSTFITMCS